MSPDPDQTTRHSGDAAPAHPAPSEAARRLRQQFSDTEWRDLVTGPGQAALYVMTASPSGVTGIFAEMQALSTVMQERVLQDPRGPLKEAMAHTFRARDLPEQPKERGKKHDELHAEAHQTLRRAAWVSARLPAEQRQEYAELLNTVAEQTANASTNGGFFGIGGERVTERERAAIAEIRTLFGGAGPQTTP